MIDKWEYKIIYLDAHINKAKEELNTLGALGWELVAIAYGCAVNTSAYLKRRVM
jgi:hypothetical protein